MICLFLTVNSKKRKQTRLLKRIKKKESCRYIFPSLPCCCQLYSPSPSTPKPSCLLFFFPISCLPDVYLQHKDGALMMPRGCQYNQRVILFIRASCQEKQRPTSYSYSAGNVNWHPRRSSLFPTALPGQR